MILFTDPHLGITRIAGTTPESRNKLSNEVAAVVETVLDYAGTDQVFCLGDLFDSFSNNEATIKSGLRIATRTTLTMAGNHDIKNSASAFGSLQLLATLLPQDNFAYAPFGERRVFKRTSLEGYLVWSIPYLSSQELFEQALDEISAQASKTGSPEGAFNVLLLHCNYDIKFETSNTTLNLSRERAEKLLNPFSYILIGHEHNHRQDFNGRLVVLGNVHPLSFGDISDKYIWILRNQSLRSKLVWSAKEHYVEASWKEIHKALEACQSPQFVKITGTMQQSEIPILSRAVVNLWKEHATILAVRNDVKLDDAYLGISAAADTEAINRLPDKISTLLASTKDREMVSMWEMLSAEVLNGSP